MTNAIETIRAKAVCSASFMLLLESNEANLTEHQRRLLVECEAKLKAFCMALEALTGEDWADIEVDILTELEGE